MTLSSKILIENYIRGEVTYAWDFIVITAINDKQKRSYENLILRKAIPSAQCGTERVPCLVIADESSVKPGNGGATLQALWKLHSLLQEGLFQSTILLLHAGGMSQRMPLTSDCGKLHLPLPIKSNQQDGDAGNVLDMLDAKLALTQPYATILSSSGGGIFVTCSDDLQPFWCHNWDVEVVGQMKNASGIIALAHPITRDDVLLASQHGLYCTAADNNNQVLQIIQKPSPELAAGCLSCPEENHFIDSAFMLRPSVSRVLLAFYAQLNYVIPCEIDAYGDILCALTTTHRPNVWQSTLKQTQPQLVQVLQHLLREITLDLLVLPRSYFVHFGTLQELQEHFFHHPKLREDLCFQSPLTTGSFTLDNHLLSVHSQISENVKLRISNSCIFYNCFIDNTKDISTREGSATLSLHINLEHDWFIGMFVLTEMGEFVTVAIGVQDDIKAVFQEAMDVRLCGQPLSSYKVMQKMQPPPPTDRVNGAFSLWNVPIFPSTPSRYDSFLLTLSLFVDPNYADFVNESCFSRPLWSLQDLFHQIH